MPNKIYKHSLFQDAFVRMYPEYYNGDELCFRTATFVVTEDCTLRCKYCYQGSKSKRFMTKETAKKAIDMIFAESMKEEGYLNPKNSKCIILDFIGGEPLLNISVIDYACEYFKWKAVMLNHHWQLYYIINVTTNGTEYFRPEVQQFLFKNKGRVNCNITLDGNRELHDSCRVFPNGSGSYDIVEKAVKHQLRFFDNPSTKLTLAPGNIHYLKEAVINLLSLGLHDIYSNCVFEEGWTIDHAKVFYTQLKELADYFIDHGVYEYAFISLFEDYIGKPVPESQDRNFCGGTGEMLAIGTDGVLYPCLRYLGNSLGEHQPPIVIGHIEDGIGATGEQRESIDCLNCVTRRSQSTDDCYNCPIGSGCAWCSAYNYQVTGSVNMRVTYICIMHKARVLANHYYFSRLGYTLSPLPPYGFFEGIIPLDEYERLLERS